VATGVDDDVSEARDRARGSYYLEIFLVSLAAILLEITLTRIFSFKVYYFFTYLVIGLCLLGLGAGGIVLAVSERLRAIPTDRLIPVLCLGAGASIGGAYFAVAPAPLNPSLLASEPVEIAKLAGACAVLTVPFALAGIVIAAILSRFPERVDRLYGTDLLGAALGCVLCVPLLLALTPPRCVMLSALLMCLAGLRHARVVRGAVPAGALLGIVFAALTAFPSLVPQPVADVTKHHPRYAADGLILDSLWHPIFRVDVAEHPIEPESARLIFHDGHLGSSIHRFDGDFEGEAVRRDLEGDPRAIPFALLPPSPRVLIIGSAGGHEILASLYFGAGSVTGVELNPRTVSLLRGKYADFWGRLHEDPRVDLVNAEGRSFLARDESRYDLIWFVAPDSYANMNAASSGAFVLSESYLYTVEMIREALAHLRPGGIVCAQFGELNYEAKPNRTARYVSTARAAFEEAGFAPFARHVLVSTSPGMNRFSNTTVLLRPDGFDAADRESFVAAAQAARNGVVRFAAGLPRPEPVARIATLPQAELETFLDRVRYDVRPVRDDSPFFWHFVRFRDAWRSPLQLGEAGTDWEDATGEQVMLVLLGLAALLAAGFLLLPLFAIRDAWRAMPHKATAGVYFAALGTGFMFLEVSLIQRFTLFLGYPTYSLTVTLFAMLVSSGLGSMWSRRLAGDSPAAPFRLLALLLVVGSSSLALLPSVFGWLAGASLAVRIAATVAIIAPLGLCLGAFMPLGLRRVSDLGVHPRAYVAWAWAVNGFFSVISSVASTILAMSVGFRAVALLALAIYVVGVFAISRVPSRPAPA